MGQRLNLEIKKGEECLANSYYHWSGYTFSAIELTNIVLDTTNKVEIEYKNDKEYAIKLLLATGAGLDSDAMIAAKEFMEVNDSLEAIDRNDGIIGITEKSIQETRDWEEARVEIDIENKTVKFDAVFSVDTDELKEDYDFTDEQIKYLAQPVTDIANIPFNEFASFGKTLEDISNASEGLAVFRDEDGYYGLIE